MKTLKNLFTAKRLFLSLLSISMLALVCAPAIAGISLATLPVAGDFSCANLLEVVGKSAQMWQDNAVNKDYMPESKVLQAIISQQTAKLDPITGTQAKNNTIKIYWVNACDIAVEDCGNECTFDGNELSTDCKEYSPNLCKEVNFKVNENNFRDSMLSPDEIVAMGFLKAQKALDEYLAQQAVLFLDANKGENVFTDGIGTPSGSGIGGQDTIIAPANWTASIMGYFSQVAIRNKIKNPFLLSGDNLYQALWNATANAANADGKGDLNKFSAMPITFDLFNIDSQLTPDLKTFLLDKGAIAFGSRNYYDAIPKEYKGKDYQIRYSVDSNGLPGVKYDVHYTTQCDISGKMVHMFKVIARAGLYLNPAGCTQTNNGVICFKNSNS